MKFLFLKGFNTEELCKKKNCGTKNQPIKRAF